MVRLYDTGLPCDSVEILNTDSGQFISTGTYLYDEESKTRTGWLDLRLLVRDENGEYSITKSLGKVEGPGVLDVKWLETSTKTLALWARSDGRVSVGSVSGDEVGRDLPPTLRLDRSFDLDLTSITMSCDWSRDATQIAAAMSSGIVYYIKDDEKTPLEGHTLEAWTVSFDLHQCHLLHSGGDDARWIGWDLRTAQRAFTCSWHSAGVCSIQPHSSDPNMIITGGYDKLAALWDRRSLRAPIRTSSAKSGVWRLRWHPSGDMRVLAACMYDGFYVFNMDTGEAISKYDPDALSYGCSWIDERTAATCSFYNRQVQIWTVEL